MIKDFANQFWHKKEILDLQKRHNNGLDLANKNSLFDNYTLQQIKEVGMVANQEHVSIAQDIECTCEIQWYTIFMPGLSILGIVIFIILNARKLKLFRGHLFSNTVKIMLVISDAQ